MALEDIKNQLPAFAKDIKLNLSAIMTMAGSPDLTEKQIIEIVLTCAYATKNQDLVHAIMIEANSILNVNEIAAAQAAATIMAMNNVYYRFVHLSTDKSFAALPAKLRMNIIQQPGCDKVDFELSCLAVSALNGCGMCMDAHTKTLLAAGVSKMAIQSSIRIAAVINALPIALQ